MCSGRVPVILYPSLYRALKLTFPTNVNGIFKDSQIMTDIGTGNLEQSTGVLNSIDFRPVCI